jgi:hypothetical protein
MQKRQQRFYGLRADDQKVMSSMNCGCPVGHGVIPEKVFLDTWKSPALAEKGVWN